MNVLKIISFSLAILGAPLFLVISALALIAFHSVDISLSVVVIEMSRLAETPLLLSLPLFIFAGTLLSESRAPERILMLSRVFLGWLPGGLAVVSLAVCAVFTAFTGASGVTIFALGGLLLPALVKDGYNERFSMGLITSSGSLGLLFPPSLPIIIYGVVSETRIDHLFLAGNGSVVFVTGERGIGKSMLVGEFLRRVRARGTPISLSAGRCVEAQGPGEPFQPFHDAVGRLLLSAGREQARSRSTTPTSTSRSAKANAAMAVVTSKKVSSGASPRTRR